MSKKPNDKSIVVAFGSLSTVPVAGAISPVPPNESPNTTVRPVARVGAGVIGATERTLSDLREERESLREKLARGTAVKLDPGLIDPSPFADRLADDSDADFAVFRKSIEEEGQKVPITVRPHPDIAGRFQIAYGHRRVRAALDLGREVDAIVKDLTDEELAVAQGIENSARQDLSWIERALFAFRLEAAAVKPRHIKAALAASDADLTRFRAVANAIPMDVIKAIGRAPKVGRSRWQSLAGAIVKDMDSVDRIRKTLPSGKVSTSDERFKLALIAALNTPARVPVEMRLEDPSGNVFGRAIFGSGEIRMKMDRTDADAFMAFIRRELPAMINRFIALKSDEER